MSKRARVAELLRAKAESSAFPAEAALFHAKADQLDLKRLQEEPFEPIPDAILYMVSLFEAS